MEVPHHVKVRGPLPHDQDSPTDLYVTKAAAVSSVLSNLERGIRKNGFVVLHATGAANYKALKISVALMKSHPGLLKSEVTTRTLETTDFYLPAVAEAEPESKCRQVNCVDIRLSKITIQ